MIKITFKNHSVSTIEKVLFDSENEGVNSKNI